MRLINANKLIREGWYLRRDKADGRCIVVMSLADVPTIEAEPVRHGHWIRKSHWCVSCSCCGKYTHDYEGEVELYNHCPYCGAKMDE